MSLPLSADWLIKFGDHQHQRQHPYLSYSITYVSRSSSANKQLLEAPSKVVEARNSCPTFSGYVRRSVRYASSSTTAWERRTSDNTNDKMESEHIGCCVSSSCKYTNTHVVKVEPDNDGFWASNESTIVDMERSKSHTDITTESNQVVISDKQVLKEEQVDDADSSGHFCDETNVELEMTCNEYNSDGNCLDSSSDVLIKIEPADACTDSYLTSSLTASSFMANSSDDVLCSERESYGSVLGCKDELADQGNDASAAVEANSKCRIVSLSDADDWNEKRQRTADKDTLKVIQISLNLPNGSVASRYSYRCHHCGKTSTDFELMTRHVADNLSLAATGDRSRLRCNMCSKRFKRRCVLLAHEAEGRCEFANPRTKTDPRPFQCLCRRRFRTIRSLERHKTTICNLTPSSTDDLKV